MFFKFLSKENGNDVKIKNYKKHKTSMDYLLDIINKETKTIRQKYRKGENGVITIGELFSTGGNIELKKAKGQTCQEIINKSLENRSRIIAIWINNDLSSEDKFRLAIEIKNEFVDFVAKKQMSSATIKKIIYDLDKESKKIKNGIEVKIELNKNARNLLSVLYNAHKDKFIEIFEDNKENIQTIKMAYKYLPNREYIKIFGFNYIIDDGNCYE